MCELSSHIFKSIFVIISLYKSVQLFHLIHCARYYRKITYFYPSKLSLSTKPYRAIEQLEISMTANIHQICCMRG